MLKQHPSLVKQAVALSDSVLVSASFYCAYLTVSVHVAIEPLAEYWLMYAGFLLCYLYFAWTGALFSVLEPTWLEDLGKRTLMPDDYHGRRLYVTFVAFSFVVVASEKIVLRRVFLWLRGRNRGVVNVLLFGRGRELSRVAKDIEQHPQWGYRLAGRMDASTEPDTFEKALASSTVDEVLFCVPHALSHAGFSLEPFLHVCATMGRPARVFLDYGGTTSLAQWQFQPYLGWHTMLAHTVELDPDQLFMKRLMDIAGGLVGAAFTIATFPVIAAAIALTSRGPVLFRQQRVGRNGRRFNIYKYRSMVVDAERRKEELEARNELRGAVFKMRDDPRVTAVGRLLRRCSIDELPQFFNVLRGEMSLVGTRPPTPAEVGQYEKWHHRRISIKPGLTGLWQVSGRNRITEFDQIVRLDLQYIDSWSIWLDVRIILRTIKAVFTREEAY